MTPWASRAIASVALLALSGCAAEAPPPAADAALSDALATPDASPATDVPARAPGFELGSNPQGANSPSAFTPLSDGDALEIVYGPQGLWMVVLAFRTRGLLDGPLALEADIATERGPLGSLSLVGQPTFAGPEGWFYHYNFFLVVEDPTTAGLDATVRFTAVDAGGARVDETLNVALTGGM